MNPETTANFAETMRGPVIGRGHPEYDDARKLHNAMIDKRPLFIARCVDAADVIAAVNFGRSTASCRSLFVEAGITRPVLPASMTVWSSTCR